MVFKKYIVFMLIILNVNLYGFSMDTTKKNLSSVINIVVSKVKNLDKVFAKSKYFFKNLQRQIKSVLSSFSGNSSDKLGQIKSFLSNVLGKIKSLI